MAWLTAVGPEIKERVVSSYRYQYATVDEEFLNNFPGYNFAIGEEVVRRIRQRIITIRWPGLTEGAAANYLSSTLETSDEYGNIQANYNGAGGYDLVADRFLVDPNGWTDWKKISELPTYSGTP